MSPLFIFLSLVSRQNAGRTSPLQLGLGILVAGVIWGTVCSHAWAEPDSPCTPWEHQIDTQHVKGEQHAKAIAQLVKLKPRCPRQPVTWRILAVVFKQSQLQLAQKSYPNIAFSPAEIDHLKALHRSFETWLAAATSQKVMAQTDVLVVNEPLKQMTLIGKTQAYWIRPTDLPPAVFKRIDWGKYQSLYVWAKVPDTVPRHGGGVTGHEAPRLFGTLYSCGMIAPRDAAGMKRQGLEPIIISHEFYHQITMALVYSLKYPHHLFPSNHPPNTIVADGKTLLPAKTTRTTWYTRVLSYYITPQMWHAILVWQQGFRLKH